MTVNICIREKKHKYKAFGLNISSDFILDELMPGDDNVGIDVEIIKGKVPLEISDVANDDFSATKDIFFLQIKETARFYVTNGNQIIVEPFKGSHPLLIKLYLLGSVIASLLLQRGILPIHGSAVVINDMCVILTGKSGAGKSTLSSALRERGHSFLTDDIAALSFDKDGTIWVQPGYPQQKLWRDSAENMGIDVNSLFQVKSDTEKYLIPAYNDFRKSPVRLVALCELKPEECDNVIITKLDGMQKLYVLINQTYYVKLLHYIEQRAEHFNQCANVAKSVPVYRMHRPRAGFTTDKQIEAILNELNLEL